MSKPTLSKIAKDWRTTVRTVSRWKAEGAPLHDAGRMRTWLASRKNLPAGTREVLASKPKARDGGGGAPQASMSTGAAAALGRLEQSEAAAFGALQRALKRGDVVEIKFARDGWLRVSESLRKYDLQVEQIRRAASELVPRSEVERFAENFANSWRLSTVRLANSLAPRLEGMETADICETLKDELIAAMVDGLALSTSSKCPAAVPDWLAAAATKPLNHTLRDADGRVKSRRLAIESGPVPCSGSGRAGRASEGRALGQAIREAVSQIHLAARSLVGLPVAELDTKLREIEGEILRHLQTIDKSNEPKPESAAQGIHEGDSTTEDPQASPTFTGNFNVTESDD